MQPVSRPTLQLNISFIYLINNGNLKSSFIYTQKLIQYLIWSSSLISSS